MNIAPLLNLLDQANHLKLLPRTGWLFAGIAQPESVAEHSYTTALLSFILAGMVNSDLHNQGLEVPLDVGRVVQIAILHDLAESLLTDLPKRSAELLGRQTKHSAEERAIGQLFEQFPNVETYLTLWGEYDAASTPEARLVKDADKLEMVHQALRYQQRGHLSLQEFWQNHQWFFAASQTVFESLCQEQESLESGRR